jgi:hypothetical protein
MWTDDFSTIEEGFLVALGSDTAIKLARLAIRYYYQKDYIKHQKVTQVYRYEMKTLTATNFYRVGLPLSRFLYALQLN